MASRPSLISTIAELGFSTSEELQEVHARQIIYGSDLETNLLELGLVSEEQLLDALSERTELPRAESGPLTVDPNRTSQLKSAGLRAAASRDDKAVVYVSDVPTPAEYAQLRELLGPETKVHITTRVRIEEAIAHLEKQQIEGRAAALLDRLGTRLPPSVRPQRESEGQAKTEEPLAHDEPPPSSSAIYQNETAPAPEVQFSEALRPVSAKMHPLEDQAPNSVNETAPPPQGYEDITASVVEAPWGEGTSTHPEKPIYAFEEATEDLNFARSRDRIIDILVHFAATSFRYTACFGILSKEAKGLKASGEGALADAMTGLHIPLDLPSAIREARDSEPFLVRRLSASGLEGGILRDLGRPGGIDTFLLPIRVRGRAILLLWGDNEKEGIHAATLTELLTFGRVVSEALERVLVERKRASRVAVPEDVRPSVTEDTSVTKGDERDSEKSLSAVDSAGDETQALTAPPRTATAKPIVEAAKTSHNAAARPATARPPEAPTPTPKASLEVAPAKKRSLTRPGHPENTHRFREDSEPPLSFPPEAQRTLRGFPKARGLAQIAKEKKQEKNPVEEPRSETTCAPLMSRRYVPVGSAAYVNTAEESEVLLPNTPAPPVIERNASSEPKLGPGQTPGGTLMSRRPQLIEPNEEEEDNPGQPEVRRIDPLNDVAGKRNSVTSLVKELLRGDEGAIGLLINSGDTAVGALIAEFPGPVKTPSEPNTLASECGPVLKALVALGEKATPFLTVRTADEDAQVRRWATFLLGELPGKDSARAIASRLLDDSIEVRRAALASARRCREHALARRTLRAQIEQICRDSQVSIESRCSAVEALADIREHEAIPTLLQLLEDPDRAVTRATRWALSVLTRQDFGADVSAWQKFWQEHRNEDRVTWLIQSLDHEQRDIRRAAGDELKAIVKNSFGFDADHERNQRQEAQKSFQAWWDDFEGKTVSSSPRASD